MDAETLKLLAILASPIAAVTIAYIRQAGNFKTVESRMEAMQNTINRMDGNIPLLLEKDAEGPRTCGYSGTFQAVIFLPSKICLL